MAMEHSAFLIVGAGITGLLIARQLGEAGEDVRVLEKGRGFGGRMATRRADLARFDHGAQYFTVRDPRFQTWVDRLVAAGIVREWFRRFPDEKGRADHPRYIGTQGMSEVGKWLAAGIDVRRETRVVTLAPTASGWMAITAEGARFTTDQLVLTAPLPQTLDLLQTCDWKFPAEIEERLRAVHYERKLAVMAELDGPSGLPDFGGMKLDHPPLTWLADNQRKGISARAAVTLHSDADFAREHWETPDAIRGPLLIDAAREFLQAQVLTFSCHRWGFSAPTQTFGAPFYHDSAARLLLAGDGFGGARVEGAALSAIEAAAHLAGAGTKG
jgi:renalase